MKNVLEMFNEICDILSYGGIDPHDLLDREPEAVALAKSIPVLGAEQPNWPLAKTVRGFVMLPDDNVRTNQSDDDDESIEDNADEPMVCWVVFNGDHPYDRDPYAPRDCWNQ